MPLVHIQTLKQARGNRTTTERTASVAGWGDAPSLANPQLALCIMSIIAEWSCVELALGVLYVHLIESHSPAAVQAFLSINGYRPKLRAVRAAALMAVHEPEYKILGRVFDFLDDVYSYRNDFAHGVWGRDSTIQDALILANAEDVISQWDTSRGSQFKGIPPERIKVYTEEALKEILALTNTAHDLVGSCVSDLMRHRAPDKPKPSELRFAPLLSEHRFHRALLPREQRNSAQATRLLSQPLPPPPAQP